MEQPMEAVQENLVNGVDTNALFATIEAISEAPQLGQAKFRATNVWQGRALNETTIGDFYVAGEERSHKKAFVFQNDEAEVLLGEDNGANPAEFILHALAGCVTTTTVYHAAARGITIRSIETTLEGDIDLQGLLQTDTDVRSGFQNIRVSMKIDSDASGEALEELKKLYLFSPIFDTIKNPVTLNVEVEA